jgi:hypothetical protein
MKDIVRAESLSAEFLTKMEVQSQQIARGRPFFSNKTTGGGDTSKGLLLPFFDGEPPKFKGWWMRFKSYATIKNFSLAIRSVAKMGLPATEATDVSSDKPKKAARDRNMMAISCHTMAFQDDAH